MPKNYRLIFLLRAFPQRYTPPLTLNKCYLGSEAKWLPFKYRLPPTVREPALVCALLFLGNHALLFPLIDCLLLIASALTAVEHFPHVAACSTPAVVSMLPHWNRFETKMAAYASLVEDVFICHYPFFTKLVPTYRQTCPLSEIQGFSVGVVERRDAIGCCDQHWLTSVANPITCLEWHLLDCEGVEPLHRDQIVLRNQVHRIHADDAIANRRHSYRIYN